LLGTEFESNDSSMCLGNSLQCMMVAAKTDSRKAKKKVMVRRKTLHLGYTGVP
jgi:hypothetical protein